MGMNQILKEVTNAFAAIKLGGRKKDAGLAALDRGVLEVALMVAALDGEILPAEYAAFGDLAKLCRGYTPKAEKACLDAALRKAGYLIAISQVASYDEKARLAAFVEMAAEAMPAGFACGSMADLRRAFALWVAMGVSDGGFSDLERRAVLALQKRFAEVKQADERKKKEQEERLLALSPVHVLAYRTKVGARNASMLEPDFIAKTEQIVKDFGAASKREKALTALRALIETVDVATENGVETVSSASLRA